MGLWGLSSGATWVLFAHDTSSLSEGILLPQCLGGLPGGSEGPRPPNWQGCVCEKSLSLAVPGVATRTRGCRGLGTVLARLVVVGPGAAT